MLLNGNLHTGVQSSENHLVSHSHFPVFMLHFPLLLQCESYLQTNSENTTLYYLTHIVVNQLDMPMEVISLERLII